MFLLLFSLLPFYQWGFCSASWVCQSFFAFLGPMSVVFHFPVWPVGCSCFALSYPVLFLHLWPLNKDSTLFLWFCWYCRLFVLLHVCTFPCNVCILKELFGACSMFFHCHKSLPTLSFLPQRTNLTGTFDQQHGSQCHHQTLFILWVVFVPCQFVWRRQIGLVNILFLEGFQIQFLHGLQHEGSDAFLHSQELFVFNYFPCVFFFPLLLSNEDFLDCFITSSWAYQWLLCL